MTQSLNMPTEVRGESRRGWAWLDAVRRAIALNGLSFVFLIAAGLCVIAPAAKAQEQAAMDYQVKAAFIVNFPKYVDWPEMTFATTNSPIVVAMLGDSDVANEFANMIAKGKSVNGHPIELKRITREDEITSDCRIVFVGNAERERNTVILQKTKAAGVLTVGDSDDFLQKGGVINLVHQGRKIRLQINLDAAREQNLKISSRLLMVADVTKGGAH